MTEYAYIIPLLQLLSFVMIVFFLRWKEKLASGFAISMIVIGWVLSIWVLIETFARYMGAHGAHVEPYEWSYLITAFHGLNLEVGFLVDPLTSIMLMVVTTVGASVQIYSLGYMHDDPRFSRFFSYLSLFLFSMLGLVLANNFFVIFIFWELVGLTSYLLIGFWFEKKVAADAGKKAFITTRTGDLGFIVGLLLIGTFAGTFNFREVFHIAGTGAIPSGILTLTAIGVFCGAVGKSAQFPLHVWLPDAMEGPTPVSALIHAATMVAAGVYLVARTMDVFVSSADASMVVATIGLITSFIAATIALTQFDIKRVLAYSTVSQLGYMIMALGLYGVDKAVGHHSSGYYAGTFHLMTHAFFKGLLFLGAGSVIHAVHTNDIREMGGLVHKMPRTSYTFMIAALSISGIFPLAGFWSKDEIVAATSGHPIFMIFTLLIAFMTAFYMWRLCFMTFFGKPRDSHRYEHAHESPGNMTWPLIFLAVLSVVAGWVAIPGWFPEFVYHHEPYHMHWNIPLMGLSLLIGASGIYLAYLMYYKGSVSPAKVVQAFKPIHYFFYNKWFFDELYSAVLIRPAQRLADFLWKFDAGAVDGAVNGTAWLTIFWAEMKQLFDTYIVDGAVNGAGWTVRQWGNLLRFLQTGTVQFYALFIILMVVILGISRVWTSSVWPLLAVIFLSGAIFLGLLSRRSGSDDEDKALEGEN